jgi:hypothetical protein
MATTVRKDLMDGIATILVIRDPDSDNEFVTEGGTKVEIIDVDLGRSFVGLDGLSYTAEPYQYEWERSLRRRVEHLPEDGRIRRRVEQLIADLEDERDGRQAA